MRIDVALVNAGLFESRTRAAEAVRDGANSKQRTIYSIQYILSEGIPYFMVNNKLQSQVLLLKMLTCYLCVVMLCLLFRVVD